MEVLVKWVVEHAPELVLSALFLLGIPVLIKVLRRDAHKKLTDKDPSNDFVAHIENDVADVLQRKVDEKILAEKITSKK